MYKKIKEKWINALRSGEYKQTAGTLRENISNDENIVYGYCCLGVLTDLYCKTRKIDFDTFNREDVLPDEVAEWAGIKGDVLANGEVMVGDLKVTSQDIDAGAGGNKGDSLHFTTLNDKRNYSFHKIATYVEKYL